jgi:hypothetical protein
MLNVGNNPFMLIDITLSVIMLSVVVQNVIVLNVVAPTSLILSNKAAYPQVKHTSQLGLGLMFAHVKWFIRWAENSLAFRSIFCSKKKIFARISIPSRSLTFWERTLYNFSAVIYAFEE